MSDTGPEKWSLAQETLRVRLSSEVKKVTRGVVLLLLLLLLLSAVTC